MIAILPIDRSAVFGTASDLITRRAENRGGKHLRTCSLLLFLASSPLAFGQSADVSPASAPQPNQPSQSHPSAIENREPDELKQELDADAIALSKIPADPLIHPDPVAPILRPVNRLVDHSIHSLRLKFGATYTVLNQYATITPDGVRHDQPSGRLDFTGAWSVYDHESTAGSISLLVRSGTNIGMSQQFNLSDKLGSGALPQLPAGRRPAGANHPEHPLLAAGFPRQEAFFLCGQDPSQRICNPQHVQQRRTHTILKWGKRR